MLPHVIAVASESSGKLKVDETQAAANVHLFSLILEFLHLHNEDTIAAFQGYW